MTAVGISEGRAILIAGILGAAAVIVAALIPVLWPSAPDTQAPSQIQQHVPPSRPAVPPAASTAPEADTNEADGRATPPDAGGLAESQPRSAQADQPTIVSQVDTLNSVLIDELSDPTELSRDSNPLSVSWRAVLSYIRSMPHGYRKRAIVNALLLAKRHPPFRLGGGNMNGGFDSPRLLRYVLSSVGLRTSPTRDERLSEALMRMTRRTLEPMPGDLVFYEGSVGYFGLIIVYLGADDDESIGVGTLESNWPGAVYHLAMNPNYPKVGYFHVVYPDEH